ncbi:MAG: hypothetical protein K5644_00655 [Lachnospiraceae bacterium]|nr:hypothetical protein [Lachnospiraceae bacterium]
MNKKKFIVPMLALCVVTCATACTQETTNNTNTNETTTQTTEAATNQNKLSRSDIAITQTLTNNNDGEHVITADGTSQSYSNTEVIKTGDSSGDEADFYGENAAIFGTNKGTLDMSSMVVDTNGAHANGVFSYGEGTTVNISDSYITTAGNCSGALMTTGGGTMNATNVTAETFGNSSATIRSDRGGGDVNVNGGYFVTNGTGSPTIYSTADITVSNAYLESTASQGVVVEGKNSVALNDATLVANNNKKNSNKSSFYQAVMIYQSMSGDADEGTSSFTMNGGSLTNANGDIFFVNNTACEISLSGANIVNNDANGVFLRAAAAGWGSSGSNGGKVNLKATNQTINGNLLADDISTLNLYMSDNSVLNGAINPDGQTGNVYVELTNGSTWTLTADSYVSSLTCDAGSINLNGHTLYVNGVAYTDGSASSGQATAITSNSSSSKSHGDNAGMSSSDSSSRPTKPEGDSSSSSHSKKPSQKK